MYIINCQQVNNVISSGNSLNITFKSGKSQNIPAVRGLSGYFFSFARIAEILDEGGVLQRGQASLAFMVVKFLKTVLKFGVELYPAAQLGDGTGPVTLLRYR